MNEIVKNATDSQDTQGTGSLAWFPRKEQPAMSVLEFTEADLKQFVERFDETPGWSRWERVSGNNGRDLIIVHLSRPEGATVRLAKSETGAYMANGFGDWGLMVCGTLDELLDAIVPGSGLASRVA
jgi:hypothetical protein